MEWTIQGTCIHDIIGMYNSCKHVMEMIMSTIRNKCEFHIVITELPVAASMKENNGSIVITKETQ